MLFLSVRVGHFLLRQARERFRLSPPVNGIIAQIFPFVFVNMQYIQFLHGFLPVEQKYIVQIMRFVYFNS